VLFRSDNQGHDPIAEYSSSEEATVRWLEKKAQLVHFKLEDTPQSPPRDDGLRIFTLRILANLEPWDSGKRGIAAGAWNNVVPYEQCLKKSRRNFAVGTGRTGVLVPQKRLMGFHPASPAIHPETDFDVHPDIHPTEQVFVTIYPLVKYVDGKVYDVFSKVQVSKQDLRNCLGIGAVGAVKIVLFYEFTAKGPMQLGCCMIDGLTVPVGEGPALTAD
jgi:hypothetical protein